MQTPIDKLKKHYDSYTAHLRAIEDAIVSQFDVPEDQRDQVRIAVETAYRVGRGTTTTDDWCDFWG